MKIIKLPFKVKKPILACGADMKGAFALAKGRDAYLFDGFGDLSDLDNLTRYEKAVKAAERKLNIRPEIVACDLHPGYFSTQFAENRDSAYFSGITATRKIGAVPFRVQHHEAHIASAIVDNNIKGPLLGVAFDGTGYGTDGNIWGGEFFVGDLKSMKRVAHLEYIPMPGGEVCIKEPWRMAASYLYSAFGSVKGYDKRRWTVLKSMIDKKINSPLTSSMGRLFDAVGSMVLNKRRAGYEAELPIELESIAEKNIDDSYGPGGIRKIVKGVVRDIEGREAAGVMSAKFHNSIAEMILATAKETKMKRVVLSGGVFQNRYLTDRVVELLNKSNFKAYTHCNVQTNDSGIPIGQIVIANERSLCV